MEVFTLQGTLGATGKKDLRNRRNVQKLKCLYPALLSEDFRALTIPDTP